MLELFWENTTRHCTRENVPVCKLSTLYKKESSILPGFSRSESDFIHRFKFFFFFTVLNCIYFETLMTTDAIHFSSLHCIIMLNENLWLHFTGT